MNSFGYYALYYNVLYQEKDYAGETQFVLSLLGEKGCAPRSLLDLGCGTGRHAWEMARHGLAVEGVDLSETMLHMGQKAFAGSGLASPALPALHHGDARRVRLGKTFDAVTSLFHVMSYQNNDEDAMAVLNTAWEHLKAGGLFLFDFWHAPCVLKTGPDHRVKIMEDDAVRILREATPTFDPDRRIVNVHYDMTLTHKADGSIFRFSEDHPMRCWYPEELRDLAWRTGFEFQAEGGWMQLNSPTDDDWAAWMLVKKTQRKASA